MFAEARPSPVESGRDRERGFQERAPPLLVHRPRPSKGQAPVNEDDKKKVPPPTLPRAPERDLEEKLKRHPNDADAKADVGSDESMDASDPSSAAQPGSQEPAPSSSFPEKQK
jgi:hypothetical protein